VIDALSVPDIGIVTCLYRGVSVGGFWSAIAVRGIDDHFLPNVLVGLTFGVAKPCFGSTIALRRETLDRIGGFAAFKDILADDNAMGQAVRGLGFKVAVPAHPVLGHVCGSTTFRALLRQDLRWARTIRAIDPGGFAGSIVTNPLPLAIIAMLAGGFGPVTATILIATLACRLALQLEIRQFADAKAEGLWLGPLRDIVSFAVFIVSFWPGSLDWRGHKFAVQADGTMASTDSTGS
jgi:ceramide glucosyltransferase